MHLNTLLATSDPAGGRNGLNGSPATSNQITVNGKYKIDIFSIAGTPNYNRGTVEIEVFDTSTGWQLIYTSGALEANQPWTAFGPDATYNPTGTVNEVRVRTLTEISTGSAGATPTQSCYARADEISVTTTTYTLDDNTLNWTASADDGGSQNKLRAG